MSHVPAVERVRTARIVVRSFTPAFGKADVKSFDYSQIDKFARAVPVNATTSVKQLASYLWASVPRGGQFTSLPAPSNNIVPFIRAVYTWTATNIKYDIRWFTQRSALPPQTADLVLKNRIGVCEGYSNLFVALCIAAGMGADVVEKKIGAAKDVTFAPGHVFLTRNKEGKPTGHAWNSVSLNGRPFMIDSTWGAGTVGVGPKGYMFEPGFQPFYFLMDPREAIYTHFPSNPVDQNLSPQCTEADFLNLPMTKPTYFEFYAMIYGGRNLISGSTIELPETGDGSVTVVPQNVANGGKTRGQRIFAVPFIAHEFGQSQPPQWSGWIRWRLCAVRRSWECSRRGSRLDGHHSLQIAWARRGISQLVHHGRRARHQATVLAGVSQRHARWRISRAAEVQPCRSPFSQDIRQQGRRRR
ncbi:hypothetical protein M427DRAFT_63868 [Gonapodya prolifera JEL478]|uniref:Transglutaminase-like domain-containing protein n=1 Tax=Gonapodya prolifera (strain JEL478) TaxID=1344416 RepID=A0A138ZYJ8_GONPJ|nr:hypothetical protein M427DRAFT_63868 [Gonapodya prolifera JEL478]|eukprot:KXS09574.1 hypothetical protein M427DRAFT_63868 [Gonapodya prolifera JEL478]